MDGGKINTEVAFQVITIVAVAVLLWGYKQDKGFIGRGNIFYYINCCSGVEQDTGKHSDIQVLSS